VDAWNLYRCTGPFGVFCTLTEINVSRTRSASVAFLGAEKFLLRYLVVPELLRFRELIQYILGS